MVETRRYLVSSEKSLCDVGSITAEADLEVEWPNKPSNSDVELGSARVFFENAKMEYFSDLVGSGLTVTAPGSNKVSISGSNGFVANGDAYPRLTALGDRDVQLRDKVKVSATVGDVLYELDAYVNGFVAASVAATVGSATAGSNNVTTRSASSTVEQVDGDETCNELSANLTNYTAWIDGNLNDTYTVEVIRASTGGDLTTARLRIRSASGLDDDTNVVPGDVGELFSVGSRGLRLSFSCASSIGELSGDDLAVGMKWTVEVLDNYTTVTGTSSGTYSGSSDTSYIVEVIQGGLFADPDSTKRPIIRGRAADGSDVGQSYVVSAADVDFLIGTKGVKFKFTNGLTGVRKGDTFLIPVTKATTGKVNTLVLSKSLPTQLQNASDLNLWLYVSRDFEVPRLNDAGEENWVADEDGVTVYSGYSATVEDFENNLIVETADVFVQYSAILLADVGKLIFVNLTDYSTKLLGPTDPVNPLKFGAFVALANSGTTGIYCLPIRSRGDVDDEKPADYLDDWSEATKALKGRRTIYNIAVLSDNHAIQSMFAGFAAANSVPTSFARNRVWTCVPGNSKEVQVSQESSDDGLVVLATVTDNPDVDGTQYTLVTLTSDNVDFIEAGVRQGSEFRVDFGYAGNNVTANNYRKFTVAEVVSADSLLLATGPDEGFSEPVKIEIYKVLSNEEELASVKTRIASLTYGDNQIRVSATWPDRFVEPGFGVVKGYFQSAALAALSSSIPPHRSMTRSEVAFFTDYRRGIDLFGLDLIQDLASGGCCVVDKEDTGAPYCLHALTTADITHVEKRSEMFVRNTDNITLLFKNGLSQFIGETNVTQETGNKIKLYVEAVGTYLASGLAEYAALGPRMTDLKVVKLSQNRLMADEWILQMTANFPLETNSIDASLTSTPTTIEIAVTG
jgi:hypothetical protein